MVFVRMIWPQTGAVAEIPEPAADGHRGLGWVPQSEWTEPEPAATDAPAADAEPAPKTSPRRRGADTPQEQ